MVLIALFEHLRMEAFAYSIVLFVYQSTQHGKAWNGNEDIRIAHFNHLSKGFVLSRCRLDGKTEYLEVMKFFIFHDVFLGQSPCFLKVTNHILKFLVVSKHGIDDFYVFRVLAK